MFASLLTAGSPLPRAGRRIRPPARHAPGGGSRSNTTRFRCRIAAAGGPPRPPCGRIPSLSRGGGLAWLASGPVAGPHLGPRCGPRSRRSFARRPHRVRVGPPSAARRFGTTPHPPTHASCRNALGATARRGSPLYAPERVVHAAARGSPLGRPLPGPRPGCGCGRQPSSPHRGSRPAGRVASRSRATAATADARLPAWHPACNRRWHASFRRLKTAARLLLAAGTPASCRRGRNPEPGPAGADSLAPSGARPAEPAGQLLTTPADAAGKNGRSVRVDPNIRSTCPPGENYSPPC